MKGIPNIPTTITVSRETGKVVEVQRAEVDRESFRETCQIIMKGLRNGKKFLQEYGKERKEAGV